MILDSPIKVLEYKQKAVMEPWIAKRWIIQVVKLVQRRKTIFVYCSCNCGSNGNKLPRVTWPLLVGHIINIWRDIRQRVPNGRYRVYNDNGSNASKVQVWWGSVMELTDAPTAAEIWLPQDFGRSRIEGPKILPTSLLPT